ncbi:Dimethylaniline monooxygenase [Mycena indigotica]|uniref:Dimethylaniline monooxygenase n=1 Tax=Mycena indigotica TaxID=2126181 RepID=A0A8H6W5L5_9AGAR|nr:Dimethylaniline monooxygenase [Mycena indigotica]KAF7303676.1 Dimethylaniline monooxygenase [Mycena indigotica]
MIPYLTVRRRTSRPPFARSFPMLRPRLVLILSLALPIVSQQQYPFDSDHQEGYEFKWPIKKVAIIGAGVSGLIAYREFNRGDFETVRVFERDSVPGGNWHYTEETPLDAPIPNVDPAIGDFQPSLPPVGRSLPTEEYYLGDEANQRWRDHRGPKPLWESLKSNAPSPVQQITELPWPQGTPWQLPHRLLARYLRAFASFHGINNNDGNPDISYNTRVELVERRHDEAGNEHGWRLTLKQLERITSQKVKATWWTEDFDAVVVATGRYNAPSLPRIKGLKEWATKFPGSVSHSRQYRRPESFHNETIVVIGAGVSDVLFLSGDFDLSLVQTSAVEIAREVNEHARHVYQSIREANPKLPYAFTRIQLSRLPPNISRIPEIKAFHVNNASIELVNGTYLYDVTRVVFGTGFHYSFPFLPQFHESGAVNKNPIVTDGTHLRALYEDFLYIEEPTIGFLSMNWGMQSFTYAEYLSLALAKVWSKKAVLPSTKELWRIYNNRIREREGYGRHLQFLGAERTTTRIRFFVAWLNQAAVRFGGRQIEGEPKANEEIMTVWSRALYGVDRFTSSGNTTTGASFVEAALATGSGDWVYGEDW